MAKKKKNQSNKDTTHKSGGLARHARTRDDHRTETAEDYVEAVADVIDEKGECRVVDLSRYFGVSHVTVSKTVRRLIGEGLLVSEPYRPITLTKEGEKLARVSRERHEIIYRFLLALGISDQTAAIDSEGIEHHVSDETLKRFEAYTRQQSKKS